LNKTDKVFTKLPDKFTREDVLEKGKEIGLSYSGASSVPDRLLYSQKIKRTGRGKYKKIESKN